MDNFSQNLILYIVGCLVFAIGLIFALRWFSKIDIKTRVKVASLLGLAGIASLVFIDTDLKSFARIIAFSIPLAAVLSFFVWINKDRLNKASKGIVALTVPVGLFLWRWIHSLSSSLDYCLGFAVCFTGVFLAFFLDEKYLKFDQKS
jgi:hypothetical protein